MDDTRFKYRHILLSNTSTTEKFTSPIGGGGSRPKIPVRDRLAHRNFLLDQLDMAGRDFEQLKNQRKATGIDEDVGIALTFRSEPDFELKFESLEFRPSGIELLSVQKRDMATYASVFIPAEWTPAMKARWEPLTTKQDWQNLIRYCGFGVPNLTRAMRSANNALTLIVQDKLYPYEKKKNYCSTRDMHIHKIPWPVEVLEEMDETEVEMRVTLSYFIEPNPARRGWIKRYGYASHLLRFDVKTPDETVDQFRKRINKAARDEKETSTTSSDSDKWTLGTQLRHKGSIHSDRWHGSAIELAQRGYIGIYPVSGWWKERHQLGRWDREARYSMIVSISTPQTDVDIYTSVANQVVIEIMI